MSPFSALLLIFLVVPVVEVYLFVQIGGIIGGLWTGLLTVFTAVLGAWLLRLQGLSTLRRMQGSMARAQVPAIELVEGVILLVAGAFLLTPGFLTDTLGFAALVPPLRRWAAARILARVAAKGLKGHTPEPGPARRSRVIEGEYTRRRD